jgi:tetratricopeptide (TPR) repeat protein
MGLLYLALKRFQESESCFLKALEIWKKTWGEKDPSVILVLRSMLDLYNQSGDRAKLEQVRQKLSELL